MASGQLRSLTDHERRMVGWLVLAIMLVAVAAFLLYETRGTAPYRDEWTWALTRRGDDVGTFLRSHFGHLSLLPIAIYRVLFATVGLGHSAPYRGVVIGAHLGCVVLLYVYARRRLGVLLGLLAAALLLFLGPAAQNIIWPFQMAWLISIGAGIGALLALDRDDRRGDVGACVLLAISLASSGIGQPVALGVAVDMLWGRRRWRDAWIVAIPVVLYAAWWLVYQDNQTSTWGDDLFLTPGFVAGAPAAVLSSLVGLPGPTTIDGPTAAFAWGVPLLVVGAVATGWRLTQLRVVPPRVVTFAAILLSFWIVTGLSRAFFGGPVAGRYVYVGAAFTLLLAVELVRGASLSRPVRVLLTVLVAAAAVSNVGAFRAAAAGLRSAGQLSRAETGALDIARPLVRPGYVSQGFLFHEVVAGPYFAAEDAIGTPADTPAQLAAEPEGVRQAADRQLVAIHGVRLHSGGAPLGATAPHVDAAVGGTATRAGACVTFRSAAFTPGATLDLLQVTLPPTGVVLRAEGGPASVGVRRFASGFQGVGQVTASRRALLRIGPDRAPQPWHVQLAPTARATVCAAR